MEMVEHLYQSLKRNGNNIKKSMETANIMKMDGNYMETVENPLPSCKLYGNYMETIWKGPPSARVETLLLCVFLKSQ